MKKMNDVSKKDEINNISEKKMNDVSKKNKIIYIAATVGVILIVAILLILFGKGNISKTLNKEESGTSPVKIYDNTDENYTGFSDEEISEMQTATPEVLPDENLVVPGNDTLDVDKISGFTCKVEGKNGNITTGDSNVTVEYVGSYNGSYVEDGSDDAVEGIAAAVITNNNENMLQYATVTFDVDEKTQAVFTVTNLPSGTSAIVLDSNRLKYEDGQTYEKAEVVDTFVEQSMLEDMFEVATANELISITNKTDVDFSAAYVYYKYYQVGGVYLGGITYRAKAENLKAGETQDIDCVHFNQTTSLLISVTYE